MNDKEFVELLEEVRSEIIAYNDNDVFTVGDILELINRLKSANKKNERIIELNDKLVKTQSAEIERYLHSIKLLEKDVQTAKSKTIKEFADKITEIFVRYAHLHNYAEKSRTETIESAEGKKIEMQSVWDVLSLKKYEMAEYEEMSELQKNIEIIAKERLLTELEKDFRLLIKEMVGDDNA